jgi:hypothetical protein
MDGSHTAWASPVSPTCLQNGSASAKCLASLFCNPRTERIAGAIGLNRRPNRRRGVNSSDQRARFAITLKTVAAKK